MPQYKLYELCIRLYIFIVADLLGTYDVNKLEVPKENNMLMLTNDGKLYHKGNTVTGLFTTAHTTLTHIFPELTFKDFAFGGNTLTVLRE